MELLCFLIGLMLGGTLGLTIMCCLQINRMNIRQASLTIPEEDN